MTPDFYCCGAGTAGDKEAVTGFQPGMWSLFKLAIFSLIREWQFEKATHHLSGFPGTMAMFYKLVHVLLEKLSFLIAMASGSLAAMAIFESVMKDFLQFQASDSVQRPNLSGASIDFLNTQRPVDGWKITLCGLASDKPGPEFYTNGVNESL
ncbi:hypothetical protein NC652_024958 [Populus alba x Populus x berolinensis]|nr:hypothetical protein NC652_024958 [Populus alba x Populus x berolinensis]